MYIINKFKEISTNPSKVTKYFLLHASHHINIGFSIAS